MTDNRLRRSLLYVPGVNPRNMIQAQFYGADSMILDLEDSVPLSEKDSARNLVFNFLQRKRITDTELIVRVNDINSKLGIEDLNAMVLAKPDIIRLPKIECANDVIIADELITEYEKKYDIELGTTKIIPGIENHIGVINSMEIAKASHRSIAISIGGEDYTASLGAERTRDGIELFYGRNQILMAAKFANLQVFDTIFANFRDNEGLKAETELIKKLGFDGKYLIHPNQVSIVNKIFTPDEKQISKAMEIVKIINEAKKINKGAIKYEDSMIDEPVVKRAITTLKRAIAAGVLKEDVDLDIE